MENSPPTRRRNVCLINAEVTMIMKNRHRRICFVLSVICYLFFAFNFCFAKYTASDISSFVNKANQGVGAETTDYKTITANIVRAGLGVVGLVFFILIFYGGYLWLTSNGKEETIKKAQDTIVASIIGLMIIVGSYMLTNLVFSRLVGGSKSDAPKVSGSESSDSEGEKKPQGCCLNETQAPGSVWSWGNAHHWQWEITDEETCGQIGNTKTDDDEIVGEGHWQWLEKIDNYDVCGEAAKKLKTN